MTNGEIGIVLAVVFLAFKETIMGQVHYAKKGLMRWIRERRR